jgi:hypothetical protein
VNYGDPELAKVRDLAGGAIASPADIRRVLDGYAYLGDWRDNYRIQSVQSSLRSARITCIDAAILSYGLLEAMLPQVQRRVLAIHRRDPRTGEEVGHCVTLWWGPDGKVGAFSKSSFKGLGHREPVFADEAAVAASLARAYVGMGFEPLYFGVTTLEQAAPDLDWRFADGNLSELSSRLQASYAYGFSVDYGCSPPSVRRCSPRSLRRVSGRR